MRFQRQQMIGRFSVLMVIGFLSLTLPAAGQQWVQTTSLPEGYDAQSLVYWNGFLYQAGGFTTNTSGSGVISSNVFYAQVFTNGTIGTWNAATPLPEPTANHGGAVANGFVYVIAGLTTGNRLTNNVYYAKINLDGSLGAWQTANPYPLSVFWLSDQPGTAGFTRSAALMNITTMPFGQPRFKPTAVYHPGPH